MKTLLKQLLLLIFTLAGTLAFGQTISGKVLYQNDPEKPIASVVVVLTNTGTHDVYTYTTDLDGSYFFEGLQPGTYEMTCNTNRLAGDITMEDAELLKQFLNGEITLSPLQMMAADVNGSGTINNGDYQLIKNHILKGHPFPAGSWQFEKETFVVGSKIAEGVPTGIGGTCSGDVGGTFIPVGRAIQAVPVELSGEQLLQTDRQFTAGITTETDLDICAAELIINYPAQLIKVQSVEFAGTGFEYVITGNQIRIVWDDNNSAPLHFAAGSRIVKINAVTNEKFNESSSAMLTLDGNSCLINAVTKKASALQLSSPLMKAGTASFTVTAYPNPCSAFANLTVTSPSDGTAKVELYNSTGKLIRILPTGNIYSGSQEIKIATNDLPLGNYLCRVKVQTGENTLLKTVQLLKIK